MANPIPTENSTVTLQAYNEAGVLVDTPTTLCGHSSITLTEGEAAAQGITDLCADEVEEIYGKVGVGDVTIEFTKFDPADAGQSLLLTSPKNTKFQMVIEFTTKEVITVKIKKRKNPDLAVGLDALRVTGTSALALIGEYQLS